MNTEKLRAFAPDLNRVAPRSPFAALEDFPVWAARLVDKCRAELLGQAGSYHFNCPMDRRFLEAAGLSPEPLRNFVVTGADDKEVAAWMLPRSKRPERTSFAGVDDFRRIRCGASSNWKIGCTGAVAPESQVKNSLRSVHSPIRTRRNHRYRMMSGIAYTTALSISMHGADQNAFGVSSPRETRNANRNSSCKHSTAWLKWSFRSIYDPGRTYYELRRGKRYGNETTSEWS